MKNPFKKDRNDGPKYELKHVVIHQDGRADQGPDVEIGNLSDAPEDVRAYFEEIGRQMKENGDSTLRLDGDNLPENVLEFLERNAEKHVQGTKGMDPYAFAKLEKFIRGGRWSEAPVSEIPPTIHENSMRRALQMDEKNALKLAEKRGKTLTDEDKDQLQAITRIYPHIFAMVAACDREWRALTTGQAVQLFRGVTTAMYAVILDITGGSDDEKNA